MCEQRGAAPVPPVVVTANPSCQSSTAVRAMRTPTTLLRPRPRPRRGHRPRPAPYTMKAMTLLVAWLASGAAEPLGAALQRRSSRPGVYADTFTRGYRPFAFVAVPLHAPVPVLHVLYPAPAPAPSSRPAPPERRRAPLASAGAGSQVMPVYAAAMPHGWFAPASPKLPPRSAPPPEETALEVVYARPTAQGGYAYSRRRTRPRPTPKRRPSLAQRPFIVRVHKYRVVRDR